MYPMTLAADACWTKTGNGRFSSGAFGSKAKRRNHRYLVSMWLIPIMNKGIQLYDILCVLLPHTKPIISHHNGT